MWLLDTSVCVALINRTDDQAAARLFEHPRASVRLCSVVKAELHFGAQNSSRLAENLQRVDIFCRAFDSLPFDDESARHYGIVRAQLRREGRPIGGNDLMIASIAIANSHVLATRNLGEFSRVSGLDVERW
ncbi:MAG: type II toxin-antitoxin system VapC family toxin [Immundisolibacterales bacterium]|nr:type II toxin-antitoxin system VapC family toxin [Immundisolibacterales bacterium]